jgi:CHASE3 domain sensor protein
VTQERINTIDNRVMNAGEELKETSLVVELVDRLIGDELRPILQSISDTVNTIRDTAVAIDNVIQAVDDIPLVSLDKIAPGENVFTQIADDITAIEEEIDATQAEVQAKREGQIEEVVNTVTTKTNEWRTSVGNVQSGLQEMDGRLENTYNNLDQLKITLPRTYIMITLLVNLLLIILGIAFASLMFHAISYIRRPEQTLRELLA